MKKLILSADPEVIEQAQRIAQETGTTVSSLFERMIRLLARKRRARTPLGPATRSATGVIRLPRGIADRALVAEAIAEKHGIAK